MRILAVDEVEQFYRELREQRARPRPGEHWLTPEEAEEQFWRPRREAAAREKAIMRWHLTHTSDGQKVTNAD
jgi:hypothetical protein